MAFSRQGRGVVSQKLPVHTYSINTTAKV